MVDCVSDATGSCMEKPTRVEKVQEQGGVYCDTVPTWSTLASFKAHTLDTLSPSLPLATSVAKVSCTRSHLACKVCKAYLTAIGAYRLRHALPEHGAEDIVLRTVLGGDIMSDSTSALTVIPTN